MTSNAIFWIWIIGLPGLALADLYFTRQMRRNLAPGLARFKGYTDWRLEGRRFSSSRDPSAYSERGKTYRRWAIFVECLFLPWFLGGVFMVAFSYGR